MCLSFPNPRLLAVATAALASTFSKITQSISKSLGDPHNPNASEAPKTIPQYSTYPDGRAAAIWVELRDFYQV
eukprot:2933935-Pyramimonas_sp.AAC.1